MPDKCPKELDLLGFSQHLFRRKKFSCLSSRTGFLNGVGFHSCVLRYPTFSYSLLPTCPSHLPLWVSGPSCISTEWGGQGTGCLVSGKRCVVLVDLLNTNGLICWPFAGLEGDKGCLLSAFLYLRTHLLGVCAIGLLVSLGSCTTFMSLPSFCINKVWLKLAGLGDREREQEPNFSLKWVRVGMLVQATDNNKKLALPKKSTRDIAGTWREKKKKQNKKPIVLPFF